MKPDFLLSPDANIYGVIMNDQITLERLGDVNDAPYKGLPKAPVLYVKPANTWRSNGDQVSLPAGETSVEVGAVIGVQMRTDVSKLNEADAMNAVARCVLAADLSLPHDSYYRPAIKQKAFDGALPLQFMHSCGLNNLQSLEIKTSINGELKDTRKMDNLLRSPAKLLADVTEFMTLYAGDILLLGVVYQSPRANIGDSVKIEVPGFAQLQFSLAQEAAV